MTDRELMNESLSVLLQAVPSGWSTDSTNRFYGVIEALRARLAQPEPEPVAWNIKHNREPRDSDNPADVLAVGKREWQGLTDEEIQELRYQIKVKGMGVYSTEDIYRAIEAKLKEKNT